MHWTISLDNAPPRVNHSAVAIDEKIYSFGGYTSNEPLPNTIDVHVFDTVNLVWWPVHYRDESSAPAGLYGHSVVAHGRKTYLWGGQTGFATTNKIFCFDIDEVKWSIPNTTGQAPEAADGHSACVVGDFMYIFGGYEQDTQRFGQEVYRVDLINYNWQLILTDGVPPVSRDFHTASSIGDRMYIFGGRSCQNSNELEEEFYNNDIMYLDTRTLTWVTPTCDGEPPCGRRSHTASVYNNEIYIIGGYEGRTERHLNDVHKFNPATNVWTKLKVRGVGPSPRRRHCACVIHDQLYLFGGSSPNEKFQIISASTLAFLLLDSNGHKLVEHSDMHVLDFSVSLKRLAQLEIIKNIWCLDLNILPKTLREEIEAMSKKNLDECQQATVKLYVLES